jgi:hypothetical protein
MMNVCEEKIRSGTACWPQKFTSVEEKIRPFYT